MKNKWLFKISLCLCLCLCMFLCSCASSSSSPEKLPENYVLSITAESDRLFAGDSLTLHADLSSVLDGFSYDDSAIIWSSSAPDIATIDKAGIIKGISEGTVTITATYSSVPEVSAQKDFTVGVHVTSVFMEESSLSLLTGSSKSEALLHAKALPENAVYQELIFTSSDESVVTVDSNGKLNAIARGQAIITVSSTDDACSDTATCAVSVTQGVTSLELSATDLQFYYGDNVTLVATVFPVDADDPSYGIQRKGIRSVMP